MKVFGMNIIVVALLCFAAVPVTPNRHEIHKRTKDDEFQKVFQATHDRVPDYKVVQVEVSEPEGRAMRNRRFVRITGHTDEINLLLEPTDGLLAGENTPVTLAYGTPYGTQYWQDRTIMRNIGQVWQDISTRSSFVMSQNSGGQYYLNGHIGTKNYAVQHVPDYLTPEYSRWARSVDGSSNSTTHVIFATKENMPFPLKSVEEHVIRNNVTSTLNRKKRNIPSTIYPEILLVVDYPSYQLHGSNAQNVAKYVLPLWNAVDMRFRKLQYPTVRLNIAHIIIATNADATLHIPDQRFDVNNKLNAQDTLRQTSEYFYEDEMRTRFPCDSYDIFMIMTSRKLTVDGMNNPLGYAIIKGACLVNPDRKMAIRNGIFHDDGSYCPWAPAHEMGHLLGAHHDDENNPANEYCPSKDGYVMTPAAISDENSWEFSQCSQMQFHEFISTGNSACLYNYPRNAGKPLPRVLPGQIMSADEQCEMMEGTDACKIASVLEKDDECLLLKCSSKTDKDYCTWNYGHGPAEGTPCHNGAGMCIGGLCVLHEKTHNRNRGY